MLLIQKIIHNKVKIKAKFNKIVKIIFKTLMMKEILFIIIIMKNKIIIILNNNKVLH